MSDFARSRWSMSNLSVLRRAMESVELSAVVGVGMGVGVEAEAEAEVLELLVVVAEVCAGGVEIKFAGDTVGVGVGEGTAIFASGARYMEAGVARGAGLGVAGAAWAIFRDASSAAFSRARRSC